MALRASLDIQWPTDLKVRGLVVENMHLADIKKNTGRLVSHVGAVIPAVPKACYDIDELFGTPVTVVFLGMRLKAEIARNLRIEACHDIPCSASLAQMIYGRQHPRNIVRLVVGRRCRDHQAYPTREGRNRRGKRKGLQIVVLWCSCQQSWIELVLDERGVSQE